MDEQQTITAWECGACPDHPRFHSAEDLNAHMEDVHSWVLGS